MYQEECYFCHSQSVLWTPVLARQNSGERVRSFVRRLYCSDNQWLTTAACVRIHDKALYIQSSNKCYILTMSLPDGDHNINRCCIVWPGYLGQQKTEITTFCYISVTCSGVSYGDVGEANDINLHTESLFISTPIQWAAHWVCADTQGHRAAL